MMFMVVGLLTFSVSFFCVWLTGVLAYRYGWVAMPRQDRWNTKPIALHGGVAIFFAFFFGVVVLHVATRVYTIPPPVLSLFGGSVLIFLIGWLDDRFNFKPSTKLIGQIIAVSLPITFGLIFAASPWHVVNIMLTFFWFITIINAINLTDNMDGLASGVVMITAMTLVALWLMDKGGFHELVVGITVVLIYAVGGFWIFNRYPASIFMGDSGSLFLGYLIAGLTVVSTRNGLVDTSPVLFSILFPAAVLSVPIFDTVFVAVNRKLHGRPASFGGRDHTSHRLVGLGFSEHHAVLILYGLSILGGLVAIAFRLWPVSSMFFVPLYILFLGFIGVYLGKVKVYPEPEHEVLKARWTPLLTQILYKRRIGEVVLDFLLIAVAYWAAYYLRFEGILTDQSTLYIQSLPLVIASCLAAFFVSGVYRGIWHLITLSDIGRFVKGVVGGALLSVFLLVVFYRFYGYSRAVFIVFGILLFLLTVGSRLSFRLVDEMIRRRADSSKTKNAVIYGAGHAGKILLEEWSSNSHYAQYRIVGFIDDDPLKQYRVLGGLTIYPPEEFIRTSRENATPPHEIWISSSHITPTCVRDLLTAITDDGTTAPSVRRFTLNMEEIARPS